MHMIFIHLSCIIISLLQEGKEIIFGEPYYTDKFQGTKRRKVEAYDKFYYVSLLELLAHLVQNKSIFNEVTASHFNPDPTKVTFVMVLYSRNVLFLVLIQLPFKSLPITMR